MAYLHNQNTFTCYGVLKMTLAATMQTEPFWFNTLFCKYEYNVRQSLFDRCGGIAGRCFSFVVNPLCAKSPL
ncbi:hypothetical protein EB241_15130 [Erwinia psidii]|uniref:Uncharacterized protein n=1 Tax=Erwinia psidii TaxID=69224 RepID=A0A3N6TPZ0_9GAMM|nr:hypothetical protein EB241_15130 [Erwinia psidii]